MTDSAQHSTGRSQQAAEMAYADPKNNLRAFMKLQLSLESAQLAYFYSGPVYGCLPDGTARPLFSYHGLLRYAITRTGAFSWDTVYRDAGYYGDLATGMPLASFNNPYTGKIVEPLPFVEGPGPGSVAPTQSVFGTGKTAFVTKKDFHVPFRFTGGTVWMEYDIFLKVPNPLTPTRWPEASTGETVPISSVTLFRGDRAAFENPAVTSVPNTRFLDNSILPWMPWMLMGNRPGGLAYRGIGWKVADLSDAPEQLLGNLKKLHPEHLLPPSEWPAGFETVWKQFSEQRPPQ